MKFSLIICTYMRAESLQRLLESLEKQTIYPDEILIIDGSTNNKTLEVFEILNLKNAQYFKVLPEQRGLTKQRNFGIEKVNQSIEIVCFLDDDVLLKKDYFEKILETYKTNPNTLGVGGFIEDDIDWEFVGNKYKPSNEEFYFDGWKRKESTRFNIRKKLGLDSNCPPGFSSLYSHGRSVSFLPPSGKTYEVEQLIGCSASFKNEIFKKIKFSTYFEGYGLYEDADFSIRVAKKGKLYVNTAAYLYHFHDASGRPNKYRYGKMVVSNGWYVWRVKNPKPVFKDKIKWHAITLLLILIRLTNIFTSNKRKEALTESLGRIVGWISLFFKKPKIQY